MIDKPKVAKNSTIFKLNSMSTLAVPNVDKTIKNATTGTIIYTALKTITLIESYILFVKLKEGIAEDPIEPFLTIDSKYPGTIRINAKNAIAPISTIYLLSNIMPNGTIEINMKRIQIIGSFAIFLKGYLKEFATIFATSTISPHPNRNTGFLS